MPLLFYNIFLFFFSAGVRLFSLFSTKARKFTEGRKNIFERLKQSIPPDAEVVWMHCASLGEFEQGLPLLEKIKILYPRYRILVTFFSPSGYEAKKNYKGADWVYYLPVDGATHARRFLEIVHPTLVLFVKYEFWYYYLKKIKYRSIRVLLISALFRNDMAFFKWYGGLYRKMLSRFDHLFVQNQESCELIDKIGLSGICSVAGDTRYDRVFDISTHSEPVPLIERFAGTDKVIIAGSTWTEDETVLQKAIDTLSEKKLKWIIAPHKVDAQHISKLRKKFPSAVFYSELSDQGNLPHSSVLIIDRIGLLSRIYKYAHIAYVGGGLKPLGVHNVLEAAVYYKPVLFGSHFQKYAEAIGLVQSGGGLPFSDPKENGTVLAELISSLLTNPEQYDFCCKAAGNFVRSQKGATDRILGYIQENRLLTN